MEIENTALSVPVVVVVMVVVCGVVVVVCTAPLLGRNEAGGTLYPYIAGKSGGREINSHKREWDGGDKGD